MARRTQRRNRQALTLAQCFPGESWNPNQPANTSPNNTGSQSLPPAQPAVIYYPYDLSEEFPQVGYGGRNAMVGPTFHYDLYPKNDSRYPEYYSGKTFVYDWMRGWIMTLAYQPDGSLKRMEPFLPSFQFDHPMDLVLGPKGDLFLLEYGTYWFSQNQDARLVHLKYAGGNRSPVAIITADREVGPVPLAVELSSKRS